MNVLCMYNVHNNQLYLTVGRALVRILYKGAKVGKEKFSILINSSKF